MRVRCLMLAAAMLSFALPSAAADPARLYLRHCQQCHGDDGRGLLPRAPDFTRNQGLTATDAQLVRYLRDGSPGKPAFRDQLSNQELLDMIQYIRTAF